MEEKPIKHSKTNVIKVSIFFLIVIFIAIILAQYLINNKFRSVIDTKFLKKEISEDSSNKIEIDTEDNPYIYAFDKYITILSKKVLTFYQEDAMASTKLDINITTPYMDSAEKYLTVAEESGNKLYLIHNTSLKWEKEVEGEIYRVNVSKNGYVSVLFKNTTHSSIIALYDTNGKELFKYYFKESHAICAEVSENNKYLAIGKIDYSGTVVKSIVEIISIDSAIQNSKNYTVYTYESESGKILNNIKFNSKNEAICRFDSYVQKVTNSSDQRLYDVKTQDAFVDMNLDDNFVVVEKETSGLFSYQYQMHIKNTIGKSDNLYILENDIPKKLKVKKDLICLNLGNEVRIINSSGWLLKRYTTNSEIHDIVIRR